jgi:hypothetical protein
MAPLGRTSGGVSTSMVENMPLAGICPGAE